MFIPESLKWLGRHEAGRRWLNRLPLVLDELVERWGLEWRGEPSSGGSLAYVAPVSRGGARFVLKVQWPHEESVHEAEALKTWNGDGAVRLIDHDGTRHALLLEECVPGTNLADAGDADPLGILAGLLPRLWKPAGQPFLPLSDVARQWALDLPQAWERAGRPCERLLVDAALEHLEALPPTQGEEVLVHQDLHGHNVLAAARRPWLVIDPKPLRGEREFSLAPIVRSFEFGHSERATRSRLDRLSSELGLNRDRVIGWTVAQTMAWSFDSSFREHHHETARWLLRAH